MSIWSSIGLDRPHDIYACEVDAQGGDLVYEIGLATTWNDCIRLTVSHRHNLGGDVQSPDGTKEWMTTLPGGHVVPVEEVQVMVPVAFARMLISGLTEAIDGLERSGDTTEATEREWLDQGAALDASATHWRNVRLGAQS